MYSDTFHTPQMELLRAIAGRRAAHLVIDNQYAFLNSNTESGSPERYEAEKFSQGLVNFTNDLAPYVLTVNVQFDLPTLNKHRENFNNRKSGHIPLSDPQYRAPYHAEKMRLATEGETKSGQVRFVGIDLINPEHKKQHIFFKKKDDAFDDAAQLQKFLLKNNCQVLLISGLYSNSCVAKTLKSDATKQFKCYAVTDRIFTDPRTPQIDKTSHEDIVASYPSRVRRLQSDFLYANIIGQPSSSTSYFPPPAFH